MSRFLIAAAHKSSGKTVISTGLAAAFHARGTSVQCFKKGPDYIDPMWLSAASHRPCYNLDFNTMTPGEMTGLLHNMSEGAELSMIEANKGLFDGVKLDGADSNAELAKQLTTPVILVIDTTGTTRGIAPLLLGYQGFDKDIQIAGVILNKVGGTRHESKLRAAVETYTNIPVLGAVGKNTALDIGERHLGLTTPAETGQLNDMIHGFGEIVANSVDLDTLQSLAKNAPRLNPPNTTLPVAPYKGLRIGVAQDASFGFYYPDDLQTFEALGATLVPFDTMTAPKLPGIDGLFIGGGFPEMQMEALAKNVPLMADIKRSIEAGLPTYAECGGLMYLCRSLQWGEDKYPMCDVVSGDAVMCERPQGRGYTKFQTLPDHPWEQPNEQLPAHEFHYARIDNLAKDTVFARQIIRGHGTDGRNDGIVIHNLLAGFCHMRNTAQNPWVARFLQFVKKNRNPKTKKPRT